MSALLLGAVALSACGGQPGPHYQGHPDGWKSEGSGANTVWFSPTDPREEYTATSNPNANGTLKDLASQVTTNVILRHKGAKFVKAQPYPTCPGEAGMQTFTINGPKGEDILRVGFTQWNGAALTASYQRPANKPDDRRALEAMTSTVCTAPLGNQKFPAAPTAAPNPHSTVVPRAKGATIFMGRPPTAPPRYTAPPSP